MAQLAVEEIDHDTGRPRLRAVKVAALPLSKDVAAAISAVSQQFGPMETITRFGVSEDDESGLTVIEIYSTLRDEAWESFLRDAWTWWETQPPAWRSSMHLAIR